MISSCNSNQPEAERLSSHTQKHLAYLASDELEGRATGSQGIEKAATYIEDFFADNKLKPFYKSYRDSFAVEDRYGYNLLAWVEGTNQELKKEHILIGAHYDHIGIQQAVNGDSIMNGANDNASGSVAVMQLAKHFSENPTQRSLIFVLFSGEEIGLKGSTHLARQMKQDQLHLYTVFNIEMIGVPLEDKSYKAYFTGYNKSNYAVQFNAYADEEVLGYLPASEEFGLYQRSDNYPFYKAFKIPSQTACSFDFTNFEYYHHVKDEVSEIDFTHLDSLIEAFIPGIEGMANAEEKEIQLN